MQNSDYLLPGIAAITLAALFPVYWFRELLQSASGSSQAMLENISTLSFSDAVFLLIGILGIYVYVSLKRALNDRLNFKRLDIVIWLVIGVNILFLATLGLDITAALLPPQSVEQHQETLIGIGIVTGVGAIIAFGLLDILIGSVLLMNAKALPTLLKIFALITLIQGLFGVTVFFAFASLITFPVSLIMLTVYFLREPETIEVV